MNSSDTTRKNTSAFYLQAAVSFGLALTTMLIAIYYLPGDAWVKAFLALGTLFLTTSSFTLAKCVRDAQEDELVFHRLDRARLEKALAEYDPFREAS